MSDAPVPTAVTARFRALCLALPEATEQETWGHPTFRVRDRIFASMGASDGVVSTTMKAAPGEQAPLLALSHPYFRPAYVGSKGWIGVHLDDDTDWDELRDLVVASYVLIAPRTLGRQVEA